MHVLKNTLAGIGVLSLIFVAFLAIAVALAGDEYDMDLADEI